MKTSKPGASDKIPKRLSSGKEDSRKPVELAEIRLEIADLVGRRALEMVEMTIEEAESGHYAAMKYLFEMIGLYPATAQLEPSGSDSLAQMLLRRLGVGEATELETKVTKGSLEV